MSEKHPCVQSMLDIISEVLDPEFEKPDPIVDKDIKVINITPEMQVILTMLQMGVDPKALGFDKNDEGDESE